jgi:hypothetical protein
VQKKSGSWRNKETMLSERVQKEKRRKKKQKRFFSLKLCPANPKVLDHSDKQKINEFHLTGK